MSRALKPADWESALRQRAPWWEEVAEAAIDRLAEPPPSGHTAKDNETTHLAWGSDDPVYTAIKYLDEVLAIDRVPPFSAHQDHLGETISRQWPGWPAFTRATVLSCLRTWFWFNVPLLRDTLRVTLKSEDSPLVTGIAVRHALKIAFASPLPELADFVRRAREGGHEDGFRATATTLGHATVLVSRPGATDRVRELNQLFAEAADFEWQSRSGKVTFLRAVLWGATEVVREPNLWTGASEAWVKVARQVIDLWPYVGDEGFDTSDFPVHALFAPFEGSWSPRERGRVFEQIAPGILKIIQRGALGDLADIHHSLREMITSGRSDQSSGRHGGQIDSLAAAVGSASPQIVRAVVDRIATWQREQRMSNDLAWGGTLYGQDTVDLIKLLVDRSRDRGHLAQELLPSVDVLADAGLTGAAASARAYFRRLVG